MPLSVAVVRPLVRKGETVSSTRVRAEILRGGLDEAAAMLGHPFSILGTVVRGRTVGRRLGYPTANIDVHGEVLPPRGVYAVQALLPGASWHRGLRHGVLNFGTCPTFAGRETGTPVLELHVLDVDRDLYGRDVEVYFARQLRAERRFDSVDALREQIARDVAHARRVLAGVPPPSV
jgi:riboflavin kinase/FMN adenylyltransferase